MAEEPIRLVCPTCDTVHRVKNVTLGKLYRCKKCKAPLVTMTPATLTCPTCGKATPPAQVEVSRLITCTVCPGEPLLQISFPPPLRPQSQVDGSAQTVTVGESLAEPEGQDWVAPEPPAAPAADEAPAPETPQLPALPQDNERAVSALKSVFDQLQDPLIQEIERSRRSVPTWLALLITLPTLAILGYLYSALLDQTREADRLRADLREQTRLVGQLRQDGAQREQELQNQRDSLALRLRQADREMSEVLANTGIIAKRAKELELRLRALGHDPDLAGPGGPAAPAAP